MHRPAIPSPIQNSSVTAKLLFQTSETDEKQQPNQQNSGWRAPTKRLVLLVGPQLTVLLLLLFYLYVGALCFRVLDVQMNEMPLTELVLFCFETLATIGYGNICPSSPAGRLFTVLYSLTGIPLCMLTIANLGKHLTKGYWLLVGALKEKRLCRPLNQPRLPLTVVLLLSVLSVIALALLFTPKDIHSATLIHLEHFYLAAISFSTIGFGDHFPRTEGCIFRLMAIICLLVFGMILFCFWFSFVRDLYMRLFLFHRRHFRHVRDVPVWFGRRRMRLSNVLEVVAREFNASPAQVHQMLNDLDFLISASTLNEKTKADLDGNA